MRVCIINDHGQELWVNADLLESRALKLDEKVLVLKLWYSVDPPHRALVKKETGETLWINQDDIRGDRPVAQLTDEEKQRIADKWRQACTWRKVYLPFANPNLVVV